MIGDIGRELAGDLKSTLSAAAQAVSAVTTVCKRIDIRDKASGTAVRTTLSVLLAVLIACAMHLQDVWWAAISGYMMTNPPSLARAVRRVIGTAVGAGLAIASVGWLAYDHFACCLALFAVSVVSIIGFNVSRHAYAWLFVSITFSLVVFSSLLDPTGAFSFGVGRIIEVTVGTSAALAVMIVLPNEVAAPAAPAYAWGDVLGCGVPVLVHAIRSGIAVAVIPVVWSTFDLLSPTTMAITVVAVLSTPVSANPGDTHRAVLMRCGQRVLGCLLGGLLALALLGLNLDVFVLWLLALAGGVWLCAYVQNSAPEAAYAGTQAGMVFLMTLVQGGGPPDSILPGVDRFVGILLGLLILFSVMLAIGEPAPEEAVVGPS